MSIKPYVSCIKIGGIPIIPPLITSQIREVCHGYKLKAIEREKRKEQRRLIKQYMDDLEHIGSQTKDLSVQTSLEYQLAFAEDSPSHVPYDTFKKLQHLTSETIDVSEYSDGGVKVLSKNAEVEQEKVTPPKLIRSNSYTLESPSPILLAHLQKEAQKCVELDDSESQSLSPITIIDSEVEPPLQVVDTDILVQQVTVSTPVKSQESHQNLDPQLLDILDKLPPEHARNILEILSKQEESNKSIKGQLINEEDKSFSVSISSQSLYYSTLSPDSTRESPNELLNVVNLHNIRNKSMDKNQAASVIQAHVRGYLVRRLIHTEKVQSVINTIKDALLCALQLQGAEVIEEADVELHRRLIQQVSAACYAFHDVFFSLSIKEQMGVIAGDRQRKIEKANRPLSATSSNLSLSRRQSARIIR